MATEAAVYDALKYHVKVDQHGTRRYYNSAGRLHRTDGPAIVWGVVAGGEWDINGVLHREDGPAIEWAAGSEWYINGLLHREDGPAAVYSDGNEWWLNGVRHRIDGPAVMRHDGTCRWFLDGFEYTERGYYKKLKQLK